MDNLPRGYDNWLQAPYQKEAKDYEYKCSNCEKHYEQDQSRCDICGEKIWQIDPDEKPDRDRDE